MTEKLAEAILKSIVGRTDRYLEQTSTGFITRKEQLTKDKIQKHLDSTDMSGLTIGVFLDESPEDDARVKAAVVDLDFKPDEIGDILKMPRISEIANLVKPHIVACSGGKGYHMYWLCNGESNRAGAVKFAAEQRKRIFVSFLIMGLTT